MTLRHLPLDLLRAVGKYLPVIDVVRLQTIVKQTIEKPEVLKLRHSYEPYVFKNITCSYHKGAFVLHWKVDDWAMKCYDRKSHSNREAVKCLHELLNL